MVITTEEDKQDRGHTIIIKKEIVIPADFAEPYIDLYFSVPEGAKKVGVRSSHTRKDSFPWIYISLFDPLKFRGSQLRYLRNGKVTYDMWVSQLDSSFGCIPGEIPDGEWRIQLDITQLKEPAAVLYEIYFETDAPAKKQLTPYFDKRVINKKPGWYKGELHSHTRESDGVLTVSELIEKARASELDFLAITDHFTVSQWWRIDEAELLDMVLINSSEITSQFGHANIHGIKEWVDVFIDRDNWSADQAAEETHKQGGLFCINHATSSLLGWRHYDFNWENADLYEIYHSLEGPNNMPQISFWDALLREGYRIIGVAGTDCHNPENEIEELGKVVTWVHTRELSAIGILEGLRNGNVFVSFEPKMEFTVENSRGETAVMGESIQSSSQPLKLAVSIESSQSLRMTIIKNGLFLHSAILEPGEDAKQVIEFEDDKPGRCYYRVELHQIFTNPTYWGIEWRDYKTIQALGNPIWVE